MRGLGESGCEWGGEMGLGGVAPSGVRRTAKSEVRAVAAGGVYVYVYVCIMFMFCAYVMFYVYVMHSFSVSHACSQ